MGIGTSGPSATLDVSGNATFTQDISVNGLTVGRGPGLVVSNTAIGYNALLANTSGNFNTAVGNGALYNNTGLPTAASENTAIGYNALYYSIAGIENTGVGANAGNFGGTNSVGSYNTYLGFYTGSTTGLANYSTALGYSAVIDASNQIVLGTPSEGVYLPGGYLQIGTTPYTAKGGYALDVSGNVNIDGSLNVTNEITAIGLNSLSDYRIKDNVTPLDNFFTVDKLNPVTYTNTKIDKQDIGLIAHELQEHYPFLVNGTKDGENLQSVNYTGLIGILIKEIQIIKAEIVRLDKNDNTIYENLVTYINHKTSS